MNWFGRKERIVLDDGVLCREVTAVGLYKDAGREMVVAKIYEDGRQLLRNIDVQGCCGWGINWPGKTYRDRYGGGDTYVAKTEPWVEPCGDISNVAWESPTDADKAVFCKKYPEFKWVFAKSDLSNASYFKLLPYWRKEPAAVETLLANGYTQLALNGSLWRARDKGAIIRWLRENKSAHNPSLALVRGCIKYGCTPEEWNAYEHEDQRRCHVQYDSFVWLKSKKKRNQSLYALVRLYHDYMKMAVKAGHDFSEGYWRFPKNLRKMHDRVMEECRLIDEARRIAAEKEAKERRERELAEKAKAYARAVKKWLGKETADGSVRVFVPTDVKEIVRHAETLHQCLVSCDYVGKVANKECVLVFIQRGDKPLATAEILPGNRLGQFYGNEANRDRCAPSKAAKAALEMWMDEFAKPKTKATTRRRIAA